MSSTSTQRATPKRRVRRRALAIGVVLGAAAALGGAAPALGATAGIITPSGVTTLGFAGSLGEQNDLTISHAGGTYTVHDAGATVTPVSPECSSVDSNTITCPDTGVVAASVSMGDQDDRAVLNIDVPASMFGGDGADDLTGGTGADEIHGQQGADTLSGREGADQLEEVTSSDGSPTTMDGGPGGDILEGGAGPETMDGGADADQLLGNAGDDQERGGDGNDVLSGGDGSDALNGEAGNDVVGILTTTAIAGTSSERGDDIVDGGPGDDVLRTGAGPDALIPDADRVSGGDGFDTVTYENRQASVRVSLDGGDNDGFLGENDRVLPDVEKAVGGTSDDTLLGSGRADTLDGGPGSDAIDGGAGNDDLQGGASDAGDDALSGGDGDDSLHGGAGNDDADGGAGNDSIDGGDDADNLQGGSGEDNMTGGAGADVAAGGSGNDRIDGGGPGVGGADVGDRLSGDSGDDALSGGDGADRLSGGTGSDTTGGGPGDDTASYEERSSGRITVSLDGRRNDGARGEQDDVEGDVEDVAGGAVDDTFTGNSGGNTLDGADGEDYVDGAAGTDSLKGGANGDVVRARDGKVDDVDCGRGRGADFAIVDPGDRVSRCETVENGKGVKPVRGEDVVVKPEAGSNQFGPTGIRRTVPLEERLQIPVGSKVNATGGRVALSSAGAHGRQSGDFSGGSFRVRQRKHSSLTELHLTGGSFKQCARSSRGRAVASRKKRIRKLSGSARGSYRTHGRYSAATVRGTKWTVEDRCDGTLTIVRRGSVKVRDFTRHRTVTVRAGHRYLAPARRR